MYLSEVRAIPKFIKKITKKVTKSNQKVTIKLSKVKKIKRQKLLKR